MRVLRLVTNGVAPLIPAVMAVVDPVPITLLDLAVELVHRDLSGLVLTEHTMSVLPLVVFSKDRDPSANLLTVVLILQDHVVEQKHEKQTDIVTP